MREHSCRKVKSCRNNESVCSVYCKTYKQNGIDIPTKPEGLSDFQVKLFYLANDRNMTDWEIAAYSGLSPNRVALLKLSQTLNPTEDDITKLAKVFRVDREFFYDKEIS